jgi:LuxR family maltose regulon positive regulatory protein
MLTGDLSTALTALEHAHRLSAASADRSGQDVAATAASLLALLHAVLGEVVAARHWLTRLSSTTTMRAGTAGCGRAVAHIHLASAAADLLVAVDELDGEAAEAASRRLALLEPAASPGPDLWAYVLHAQAHYALHHGDVFAALDRIARSQATRADHLGDSDLATPLLAAARANLLIAAGRANQAQRCLRGVPEHGLLHVPRARLALLGGDTGSAAEIAADRSWACTASTRDRVEMQLIQAVAAGRSSDLSLAGDAVDRAVRAAREAGLRSAWATVPRTELGRLAHLSPALAQLLADPAQAPAREVYPASAVLIGLTYREREVLDQLAGGATLGQAADALAISYNTVKTHAHSLYRKLHVGSRHAAVIEAQRLGLLDAWRD